MSDDRGDPPDPSPLSAGLDRVLRGLGAPPVAALVEVQRQWHLVVGDDVATHARARVVEGRLVVDVDHPAWASRVRFAEAGILGWLDELLGGGVVSRVDIRVVEPDTG